MAELTSQLVATLHEALSERLSEMKWGGKPPNDRSMLDFFDEYIAPFGEWASKDWARRTRFGDARGHTRVRWRGRTYNVW